MLKKILKKISSKLQCKAGELYTIPLEGQYGIFKVIKVDSRGLHVRVYSNLYIKHPSKVNEKELYINEKDSYGREHTPLTYSSLKLWKPLYLQDSKVTAEELSSYLKWQNSNQYYI